MKINNKMYICESCNKVQNFENKGQGKGHKVIDPGFIWIVEYAWQWKSLQKEYSCKVRQVRGFHRTQKDILA